MVSLPFLFLAARRPVLRRLALRNAARRPRETALVVLGSLLGTSIITGSMVVGDTLDASLRQGAQTKLGPVDELVSTSSATEQGELTVALQALDDDSEAIDGVLALTTLPAAVAVLGPDGEALRAEPTATVVEVDFGAARAFGGDPAATGIEGPTPAPGRTVVGEDLAEELGVGGGATIVVYAFARQLELAVDRVVAQRGIAGFSPGFGSRSPNLFVAPGTLAELAQAAPAEAAPPSTLVAVSNRGGPLEGADATEEATAAITAHLGTAPGGLSAAKSELLADAEAVGAEFTELFGSIGFFSVIAGVLLLVNIFVMLAQERKSEMGMLRAVGLRRAGLVGSFSLEGWMYALVSALLGTLVGIGIGRVVAGVAADIFGGAEQSLELTFAVDPASVESGFTVGFIISLLTVALTSLSIARVNVIRAIRDLPEPAPPRTRLRALVAGAGIVLAAGAWTAWGIPGDEPYATLAGPVLVLAGLVPLLSRFLPRRLLVSVAAVAVLAWAISAFGVLPDAFEGVEIPIFVVQGVVLTAAAVALATRNQEAVGAVVRRLGGGRSMAVRLGLAYPLARRFRTGMILAMYSLVVFTLVFIVVLSNLFSSQIDSFTADVAGGFELQVSSNATNPVPVEEVRSRDDVVAAAALSDADAEFLTPRTEGEFEPWFVTGIDEVFVGQGPTGLGDVGTYPDADAAYRAVLADPGLTIVSDFFLQDGGGPPEEPLEPGERITLRDPVSGSARQLTIAAVSDSSFAEAGAYVSQDSLRELYGPRATANRILVATSDAADPEEVAAELNAAYLANGAEAETFRELVATNLASQTQFFRLMQGYLALGLVVGIAGLGVVMVRAVRERRRQIGVLRALGYPSGAVRRAFVVESAFVAAEGIFIGTTLALITAWQLVGNDTFGDDLPFAVPWAEVALLVVVTFVVSLLATAAPAQQASRIRPAVALRLAD
ncbi:MAG: ABC transporter permease [Actinobacteria bacterium]|nr:ABC transporter permease [Actinomycetota bacterium]